MAPQVSVSGVLLSYTSQFLQEAVLQPPGLHTYLRLPHSRCWRREWGWRSPCSIHRASLDPILPPCLTFILSCEVIPKPRASPFQSLLRAPFSLLPTLIGFPSWLCHEECLVQALSGCHPAKSKGYFFGPHLTLPLRRIQHSLVFPLSRNFLLIPWQEISLLLCSPFPSIFRKCKTYMSLSCSKHTKASLHNLKYPVSLPWSARLHIICPCPSSSSLTILYALALLQPTCLLSVAQIHPTWFPVGVWHLFFSMKLKNHLLT